MNKSTFFDEKIKHFSCGDCAKWWSIGDAPDDRAKWFCPWCGKEQEPKKDKNSPG